MKSSCNDGIDLTDLAQSLECTEYAVAGPIVIPQSLDERIRGLCQSFI